MRNTLALCCSMLTLISSCKSSKSDELIYKDASMPVEDRIEDLLSRMTIAEKVGQMNQLVGIEHIKENTKTMSEKDLETNMATAFYPGVSIKQIEEMTARGEIGSYLHVVRGEEAEQLQKLAMQSRLQIPILFGIDAIHGNANCPDNTVYPTNIGLSCSFDPEMAYKIARETAAEMRAMNMHWTFNPNVEVARDARWGRVGETYGEDTYLVGQLGAASVRGYQGEFNSNKDVLACIKHFVGGSEPINGANAAPADLSDHSLREIHFPPYQEGVKAGALSLMTAHNELNGVPCHNNKWLMQDILRDEWGFQGFVVSDWMDIERLHDLHATAETLKEAYYQTIMSGMDMHMHGVEWNKLVLELVEEGRIPESRIDESVRRILYTKFKLGLFEEPYVDMSQSMKVRMNEEHMKTALEASRNSIVLLKNDGILPLDASKYDNILVTGINANDENIMGDWSAQQKPENVTTILEGLKMVSPNTNFDFVDQGWDPQHMSQAKVDEAVRQARKADLAVVVAGEYMMRHRWNERTSGENVDRPDLNLVGLQSELIRRIHETGTPVVLVLVNGRPLSTLWEAENLPAIVEAWEPGMLGGQTVAEVIYGEVNPSAKLSISIPRYVGQIQIAYNRKKSATFLPYTCGSVEPLYPFGHGLSYTDYDYSDFKLNKTEYKPGEPIEVSLKVTNTGDREGTEIVQLYIRDQFSSVTRPLKELKDFARVTLAPKETKTVQFTLPQEKLAFYNQDKQYVVEPGAFNVMVGPSSRDEDLMTETFYVQNN